MTRSEFRRVTREHHCPICAKVNWCGITADGAFAICMRVSEGSLRATANGGHLHRLRELHPLAAKPVHRVELAPKPTDLSPLWRPRLEESWRRPRRLEVLLAGLGLALGSTQSLLAFEWAGELHVPCQDAERRWTAIQRRTATGAKFYARRAGEPTHCPAPFTPLPIGPDPLLVVEGFSDAAALGGLGLTAIGRTTARPGRFELDVLRHLVRGRHVAIIGEHDRKADGRWPGREGAEFCASALLLTAASVRVVFPPPAHKDGRDWIRAGASRADLEAAIAAAEPMRVELDVRGGCP